MDDKERKRRVYLVDLVMSAGLRAGVTYSRDQVRLCVDLACEAWIDTVKAIQNRTQMAGEELGWLAATLALKEVLVNAQATLEALDKQMGGQCPACQMERAQQDAETMGDFVEELKAAGFKMKAAGEGFFMLERDPDDETRH